MSRLSAIILGTTIAVVQPTIAWAQDVYDMAKEITVFIDGCSSGSGVIYDKKGNTYYVLTAYHVVDENPRFCRVITTDGESYDPGPDNIEPIGSLDLAVVKFVSNKRYQKGKLGDSKPITIGKTVYVAGAPPSDLRIVDMERTIRVSEGKIIGRASQASEGYTLIYDNTTRGGMSGGPILNTEGEIIGIHGKGDLKDGSKENYGIPIEKFQEARGSSFGKRQGPPDGTDARDESSGNGGEGLSLPLILLGGLAILGGGAGLLSLGYLFGSRTQGKNKTKVSYSPPRKVISTTESPSRVVREREPEPKVAPNPVTPSRSEPPRPVKQPTILHVDHSEVTAKSEERVPAKENINRDRQQAADFAEDLGNGIILEMASIPGGSFLMGSPESEERRYHEWESPQHRVTIAPFYMGKYSVTQAQWQAVAELRPVKHELDPDPSRFKGANRPVESISWHDAVEFCARLSRETGRHYRLPSEAEWEYACRAGTTTPFHFGETITPDLANYDGDYIYGSGSKGVYRRETIDVGSFPPNAFNLYDMHGNVWEWCADPWHENYEGAPADGSVWESGGNYSPRSIRGGSWGFNPRYCRSANRNWDAPGFRDDSNGLRVVCVFSR